MSDDDRRAPKAKVDLVDEDAGSFAAQEQHGERDDAKDEAPEASSDPVKDGFGSKVSAWVSRTLPGHENAFVGGVLGLVAAILVFCVGALNTILIVVLVMVGVSLGQILDGDPKIVNAVIKFFSDRRE